MEASFEPEAWAGLEELHEDLREFLERRCRDAAEVDDVLQETWLRAARYRRDLVEPAKLRGWAMRIAANVLRDLQRRQGRLPRAYLGEGSLERLLGAEPDPADPDAEVCVRVGSGWVGRGAALREMGRALGELRPEERRVLASYYGGGECGARTARECGLPRPLVKVRLFRARKSLERRLRPRLAGLVARASGGRLA